MSKRDKRAADHIIVSPTIEQVPKRMDNKCSPEKEDAVMNNYKKEALEMVEGTAPNWFVNVFAYLFQELHTIKQDKDVETVKAELKSDIATLENKVSQLEPKTKQQETSIKSLEEEVLALQTYSRKDNLLIDGISESPNEDVCMKLCIFFKDKLGISNTGEIKFVRCHRLGRPPHMISDSMNRHRTIIVKYLLYSDCKKVWKAS